MAKIEADGVYKVFGPDPEGALAMLSDGADGEEIEKSTGNVVAVRDANFTVERGELFVVMGLSGSGKSTLVRMINRLIEPSAGEVRIDGQNVSTLAPKALRKLRAERISMVFQRFALFPHRSVLDNVAYGLAVRGVEEEERGATAKAALGRVGLGGWETRFPRELSGGMQQRVGLARALATDADILLMDEPFSALDPLIRRDIQVQLLELQEELHKTIVFITHDLNEAMLLGDHIAVMKDGRIVQIGTAEDLLTDPADDYVAAFTADVDRSRVLTAGSVMREPAATLSPRDGPRTATHLMQELDRRELYVLGHDRHVLGWVRDEDLGKLRREGSERLELVMRTDYPRTTPDTPIAQLFGLAASHTLPIAVMDDEDTLLGVIPRPMLLAALDGDSEEPS